MNWNVHTNPIAMQMRPALSDIIQGHNLVTDKDILHSYCDQFYDKEFVIYRDKPIQLVEIGIDQGGSLILWANYFTNAKILGVDLQLRGDCEKNCSRYPNIMLSLGNAYLVESLQYFPDADVIIDDGSHTLEDQLFVVRFLTSKIKAGGILVVEDIPSIEQAKILFDNVPMHLMPYAQIIDLRNVKGRNDDILLVIRYPDLRTSLTVEANNEFIQRIEQDSKRLGMDMLGERLSHLYPLINFDSIHSIIDVGAAHGYESINLARIFPKATLHSFEADPENYVQALENISNQADLQYRRINLMNMAVNNKDGPLTFYALDRQASKGHNEGMSSKYKLSDPAVFPHELSIQKEIMIPGVTLDTWCKIHGLKPDLLWMDAQGAELDILKGAEEALKLISVIMTEAAIKPYYEGQTLKVDIDAYLKSQGFEELESARKTGHEYEVDAIYLRIRYV